MRSYEEAAASIAAGVRNSNIKDLTQFVAEIMHNAARTETDVIGQGALKGCWQISCVSMAFDDARARLLVAGVLTSVPVAGLNAERQYRLSAAACVLASVVHQRRTSGIRRRLHVVQAEASN